MNETRPQWTPSDSKSRGGFDTKVAFPFQEKEAKTLIGVRFAKSISHFVSANKNLVRRPRLILRLWLLAATAAGSGSSPVVVVRLYLR